MIWAANWTGSKIYLTNNGKDVVGCRNWIEVIKTIRAQDIIHSTTDNNDSHPLFKAGSTNQ